MPKLILTAILAVVVAGVAYAGWFGWGEKEAATKTVPMTEAPVQIPADVMAELPPGHPLNIQSFDRVLGDANAPVTIIEYASMTCGHCAKFHNGTLQEIKKDWIDTGKAKYVLRDMPWDNLALGISKVARCAPPEMFYPLVNAYFAAQEDIVTGVDTLGEVKKVARVAGLDGDKVEACIQDGPLQALINGVKDNAVAQLNVTGTPTTFINGVKLDGAVPYTEAKPVLENAYRAAMVAKAEQEKAASATPATE